MPKRKNRRKRRKRMPVNRIRTKLALVNNIISHNLVGEVNAVVHFRSMSTSYVPNIVAGAPTPIPMNNRSKLKDLFDMYRATYIRLKYTPFFSVNEHNFNNTGTLPQIMINFDADSTSESSVQDMLVSPKTIYRRLDQSWTYSKRIPRYHDNNSVLGWQNMQAESQNLAGILSIKTTSASTSATVVGQPYGALVVEMWVECKNRVDGNAGSYNGIKADGSVATGSDLNVLSGADYLALTATTEDGLDPSYKP